MNARKRTAQTILACMTAVAITGTAYADTSAKKTEDGKFLLENKYYQITFDAQKGGRAVSVKFLPWQADLTAGSGFFVDSFRDIGKKGELFDFGFIYRDYPYQAEIVSPSGAEACIRFTLDLGKLDERYKGWTMERECALKDNDPILHVKVRFTNGGAEKCSFAYRPSHLVDFPNETVWYYIPDGAGAMRDFDPPKESGDGRGSHGLYTLYPADAWMACLAEGPSRGLACEFEWKYLDTMEAWISVRTGSLMQWFYRMIPLAPGAKWETAYTIYPIEGLQSVDGVRESLAGGITVGKTADKKNPVARQELKAGEKAPVTVSLSSPLARTLRVRISEKSEAGARMLKEENVSLKPFASSSVGADWQVPAGDHLTVISAEISEDGKTVLALEKPVETGNPFAFYEAPVPKQPQEGEKAGIVHAHAPLPDCVKQLDLSVVSAHEKWASPYAGGKTRLLFVYRNHNLANLREIYERGDFELSLLATEDKKPYEQMKDLPKQVKEFNPDIIFMMAFDWKAGLPAGIASFIKKWVYNGGGLVADANLKDPMYLPLAELVGEGSEIKAEGVLPRSPFAVAPMQLYQVGKGRVVIIPGGLVGSKGHSLNIGEWRPNPWIRGQEYGYARLVGALLWSARREMPVVFGPIVTNDGNCRVDMTAPADIAKITLKREIRNGYYEPFAAGEESVSFSGGKASAALVRMDDLQDGLNLVKVVAYNPKGQVVGWTAGKVDKKPSVAVELSCSHTNDAYRRNEKVEIALSITPPTGAVSAVAGELFIRDSWGRTIWRTDAVKAGQARFEPDMSLAVDIWHEIVLKVSSGGKNACEKRRLLFWYPLQNIPSDDFSAGCWGHFYGDPFSDMTARSSVEAGIDLIYSYGGEIARDQTYRNHARIYGPPFANNHFATHEWLKNRDSKTLVMTPPLYPDEAEWQKAKEEMIAKSRQYGQDLGADAMIMDDERDLKGEYDWSTNTLAHFPQWLEKEYGSIKALNKAWGTKYRSFSEAQPAREKDMSAATIAPWMDYRKYNGWIVEEFYTRKPMEWAKEGNPLATVGMHGIYTTGPTRPWDMSKVIPLMRITGRYNGILEEWFRGMGEGNIHGQYTGYEMRDTLVYENRITPWKNLFHGSRWVLFYQMRNMASAGGVFQSIINYDGTARKIYQDLYREELKEMKDGIGKLVLNAKLLHEGVIFTYSYSSCVLGRHVNAFFAAKTLLQDIGYQHDLISYRRLEEGALPKEAKVIFLADCICMSQAEVDAVKAFVSAGGTVVADAQAAVFDAHGARYTPSPLDEVFGVDRSSAVFAPAKLPVAFGNDSQTRDMWVAETGLKLLPGAAPLARASQPVMVEHTYGKGKAVYLNLHLEPYTRLAGAGAAGEIVIEQPGDKEMTDSYQGAFARLLSDNFGLEPAAKIAPLAPCKEVFSYACPGGRSRLLGILASPSLKEETSVTLSLPEARAVYDVRKGALLGRDVKVGLRIAPQKASLFAVLPYSVKRLALDEPKACRPGETAVVTGHLETDSGKSDGHVVRVTVSGPDGKDVPFWSAKASVADDAFTVSLPVDFDMVPGVYTLTARDIMTGTTASQKLKIAKAAK